MTLEPGDSVPPAAARNQDGDRVELDFATPTVLYFYPRDDTRGCTIEAREFDAELDAFQRAGVEVYGVSTDDVDSHADFADEQGLGFDLLADPDGEIAAALGVELQETPGEPAAPRTTFVLTNGEVWAIYPDVDPEGHAERVLSDMEGAGLV